MKIAVLIAGGFENSEYTGPTEAYKKTGHTLDHIGHKAGEEVKGNTFDFVLPATGPVGAFVLDGPTTWTSAGRTRSSPPGAAERPLARSRFAGQARAVGLSVP